MKITKSRYILGFTAAVSFLLGVGLWLALARGGARGPAETDANKPLVSHGATPRTDARADSTTTLLGSDKAVVVGTIRDEQGHGIAGATVCAWSDQDELRGAGNARPRCVTSEQDGRYRLEGLWPVSTGITANARGFRPERWSERNDGRRNYQRRLQPGREHRGVDITLARGGVVVRGVVKDISGGVIEGALVSADGGRAIGWTDADGGFELWVAPGNVPIWAVADGYAGANVGVLAPTQRAELFLTPESVISGVVVHAETGAPVASATVRARVSGFLRSSSGVALTDEQGRFRITGLEPGIYDVTALTDEHYGEAAEQIHGGLAEQAETTVRVFPAFAIRGRVVIAESGKACPSGRVSLSGDDFDRYNSIEDDGTVLIRAVVPGEYQVSVTCGGYRSEDHYDPLVVADEHFDGLEWQVHTGLAIRGVVVDHDGTAVGKVNVRASPKAQPGDDPRAQRTSSWGVHVESDGAFEIAGLLPGTYEVTAWGAGHPAMPEPVVVELREGADAEGVRVVMPATGRLQGIVRDDAGDAVPGVWVSASLTDAWSSDSVRTNDDGRFAFEHLGAGTYRVTVQLDWADPMRAPGTTDDDVQGELVELAVGRTAEMELVVERRSGSIRGRVLDSDGAPVTDAFVDATRISDSAASNPMLSRMRMQWGWDRQPVLTDHDGWFELRELAEGNYLIRAYREGGGEALLEGVAAGTDDAVLTIVETGRIAGKVIDVGGSSPTRFSVKASDRNTGLSRSDRFFRTDGTFSLSELPPGKYELTVSASEGSAKLNVELGPGEVVDDLVIELVGKVTVKGRLIDAETGAPVPGFRVSVVEQRGTYIFGDSADGDRRDVSDADGRFEVDDAPTGKVQLTVVPRDFAKRGKYGWTQRSINLRSEPKVQELGDIELLASRLDEDQRAGDTGFKTKPNAPDVEPEDIVFEVAVIRPGGPADACGLAVGDRIVEIDGFAVSGLDSHRYDKLIAAPAGTVLELTLEGGKTVSLELGPPLDW